jgi:hypothetical protein
MVWGVAVEVAKQKREYEVRCKWRRLNASRDALGSSDEARKTSRRTNWSVSWMIAYLD